uniref:Coiled-coil domain containing 175 n=1 Tax=Nothobranchius furzeri TaxID=105023 RepID=A0A1A8V4L3_NOTFU
MAFCSVPDFPAVLLALEGLNDLNKQLKDDGVQFAPEASIHLAAITASITKLEANRRIAHDQLEVETIETSKLRHQIKNMSDRVRNEILADVAAARASNGEKMEQLRKDLHTASQHREDTVGKLQGLLNQNKTLHSEQEQVKAEHKAAIATLNDQVDLKYSLQKKLDQTLQRTEALEYSISAIREKKASLQQSMMLHREACSEEKHTLSREINEMVEKIKQQENVVSKRHQELDVINDKKEKALCHLGELGTRRSKVERSLQKLTSSRCQLEQQLDEETNRNQELRQQIEMQKKEFHESQNTFSLTLQSLKEQIAVISAKIENGRASGPVLKNTLSQVQEIFRRQHNKENEAQANYLSVSQQLEQSKLRLEECIASVNIYNYEIMMMEKQISKLQEQENVTRCVFERKHGDICSDLKAVKDAISQCEEEKRNLAQLLEETKSIQEEHMENMMSEISNTRRRYEELQQEEATLLQLQPKCADPDLLMSYVTQTEMEYREMENTFQQEMQQITAKTEHFYRSTEEKQKELEEKQEVLKELEVKWNEEKNRHEGLSDLLRDLNRKRAELELLIQDTKNQISVLLQPREVLKAQLEKEQKSFTDTLCKYSSDLRTVEVSIYNNHSVLQKVEEEKSRMDLRIREMMEDISVYQQEKERYQQEVQELEDKIKCTLGSLEKMWKEDLSVALEWESKDEVLFVSINSLLDQLKTREHHLMDVNTLVHLQMMNFSKRLGDKAAAKQQNYQKIMTYNLCSKKKVNNQSSN